MAKGSYSTKSHLQVFSMKAAGREKRHLAKAGKNFKWDKRETSTDWGRNFLKEIFSNAGL